MEQQTYKFENFAHFYDFLLQNWKDFEQNKTLEYFKWLGDTLTNCNCNLTDKLKKLEEMYGSINNIISESETIKIKMINKCDKIEFWNNEKFICIL